jgi:hypothetical protein
LTFFADIPVPVAAATARRDSLKDVTDVGFPKPSRPGGSGSKNGIDGGGDAGPVEHIGSKRPLSWAEDCNSVHKDPCNAIWVYGMDASMEFGVEEANGGDAECRPYPRKLAISSGLGEVMPTLDRPTLVLNALRALRGRLSAYAVAQRQLLSTAD